MCRDNESLYKDAQWCWITEHEKDVKAIKEIVTSVMILPYFVTL